MEQSVHSGQLEPYLAGGASPERIDSLEGTEMPQSANLRELPLGTVIQFHGQHPGSRYISKVIEQDNDRKIIIWLLGREPPAIGSIDAIVSMPPKRSGGDIERGVIKIGAYYVMPTFNFKDDYLYGTGNPLFLEGGMNLRLEPFKKLFVRKPDQ